MKDKPSSFQSMESELTSYHHSGYVPLHMPGHKQQLCPFLSAFPMHLDVTELTDTDDLHHPEGMIREAMARTAALYGADVTWYVVGGSTTGLLAGIRAAAGDDTQVVVARNAHKSVYHALELCRSRPVWMMPDFSARWGCCGSVSPREAQRALEAAPDARAMILTSPTYEGVLSDIASIAECCHARGIPLVVDAAHGAHLDLPFSAKTFPAGALRSGADLVIQSPHKTLCSLTQTAWIHVKGTLISQTELQRQLEVFETSSPSYILMTSLDGCTRILRDEGERLFAQWGQRLEAFYQKAKTLQGIRVWQPKEDPGVFCKDPSKLVLQGTGALRDGQRLGKQLRDSFHIETEMTAKDYVLAMTGMGDTDDCLDRLFQALAAMDGDRLNSACAYNAIGTGIQLPGPALMPPHEAMRKKTIHLPLARAAGHLAGAYVWAYPPGIPLIVPGERITSSWIEMVQELVCSGVKLHISPGTAPLLNAMPVIA